MKKTLKKFRLTWSAGWSILFCSFVLAWLFDRFGRLPMMMPSVGSVAALYLVLLRKWTLREEAWFWAAIIVLCALHVLIIWSVNWPTRWVPGSAYAGATAMDICVMLVIINSLARLFRYRSRKQNIRIETT
jgi:hypothetical protein